MNGIIPVFKEKGYTSFDAIAKLRRILHIKKMGHTGTLDPDAEGVLVICVGAATRLIPLFSDDTKSYEAVLRLGIVTDTQDMTGTVLSEKEVTCTEEELRACAMSFQGGYLQTPPAYSAKQVDGKRLYALAREGKSAVAPPKQVELDLAVESIDLPFARLSVTCSKGTYIRTLCHDIGAKLGCGGTMASLLRTRCGRVDISMCRTIPEIGECAGRGDLSFLIPPEDFFSEYSSLHVSGQTAHLALNGNRFRCRGAFDDSEVIKVFTEDKGMIGLFRYDKKYRVLRPYIIFPRES